MTPHGVAVKRLKRDEKNSSLMYFPSYVYFWNSFYYNKSQKYREKAGFTRLICTAIPIFPTEK